MVKLKLKLLLCTCYLQAPMYFELGLSFGSVLSLPLLGWVGVEIEVNANSAKVEVEVEAELGKRKD